MLRKCVKQFKHRPCFRGPGPWRRTRMQPAAGPGHGSSPDSCINAVFEARITTLFLSLVLTVLHIEIRVWQVTTPIPVMTP
jgi:hypothetical protein